MSHTPSLTLWPLQHLVATVQQLMAAGCVVLLMFSALHADEKTSPIAERPATDATAPAVAPQITRADLAASYLRLEEAYFANPPSGEKRVAINKGFDQATLAFFTGRNADAIRMIDGLTQSLGPQPPTAEQRVAASLKVTLEPPVWSADLPVPATARVQSIYEPPLKMPQQVELILRLVDPQGKTVLEQPLELTAGPGHPVAIGVPLELSGKAVSPGMYRVELVALGATFNATRVSVVAGRSLDEQRAANEMRLAKIAAASPALLEALASCKARNALLTNRPAESNSAQFLADLQSLAVQVDKEIEELAAGRDPYFRRGGDYWRVLTTASGDIPLRVYAPPSVSTDKPSPLLIVLHGAGGDENMFLEAYGVGAIKRIADEKGLLVVSPLTYRFGSGPKNFDKLLEATSHDYLVDRERVYVLGHSMGAGTVAGLARSRADAIAAACCIAGGNFVEEAASAPLLAIIAQLDAVVPAKRLQGGAEKAAAGGSPIEIRSMPELGHTLVVGTVLGEAVDWLLEHRRSERPAK